MAQKKITILGAAGDSSLSPEEAQKIEVRVDKMLALEEGSQPEQLLEYQPATTLSPAAATDPIAETEVEPAGAPPLDKKLIKKITVIDTTDTESEADNDVPDGPGLEPPEIPSMPPKITITDPDLEVINTAEPEIVADDTVEPAAPAPEPEVESDGQPAKKHRPPDGPLPFKRAATAEPATATAEASPRALTAEEQEDAAIAAAFAAKEPAPAHTAKRPTRKTRRILGVILVFLVVAAASLALPAVRQRVRDVSQPAPAAKTQSKATQPSTAATTPVATAPVPDIFVAKQDGIYNVYTVNQTGQSKQRLLAGSGYETSPTTQLVANADGSLAALVSLHDNSKDDAGYPLQTLSLITVATPAAATVAQAQRLQILGWHGSTFVYVASKTGAAAASDPNGYQLMAYNTATKQKQVLDHAVHFNAVLAVHDWIFYATDGANPALYRINADGTGKRAILNKAVTNLYRTDYTAMAIATAAGWYNLDISAANAVPVSTVNAYTGTSKLFVDAPDKRSSLHIETRGGTPTLLLYDLATKQDTVASQKSGLAYPLHWLSSSVAVFRIDTDAETADYSVDTAKAAVTKLTDTSSFHGLEP